MIKMILHRIWNERRQNACLFIELVVVSIFLWIAIDPLFVLLSHEYIPKGYDYSNIYSLNFKDKKNVQADDSQKACANDFAQVVNSVRGLPEVENYAVALRNSYPNSYETNCPEYRADTTEVQLNESFSVTTYEVYDFPGSDYFAMMKIRDAYTGEILKKSTVNDGHGAYVSRNFALAMFGTLDVVGKTISYSSDNILQTILGVFDNVQTMQYVEPMYLVIILHDRSAALSSRDPFYNKNVYLRLKKDVDKEEFAQHLSSAVIPGVGLTYKNFDTMEPLVDKAAVARRTFGIESRYRLQTIFSCFALFCVFLGIMSTYWVRVSSRKKDLGLMRSVGATSGNVFWYFLVEGWLLVTLAFIVALPLLLHKVYSMGFADPLAKMMSMMYEKLLLPKDSAYLHNRPMVHFVVVSAVTYLFMLIVATIGILFPVRTTARIQPSEALGEE